MKLGELIKRLKLQDRDKVLEHGFKAPHSYRGYYDQLAFEPVSPGFVREMLLAAESALNKVFEGYKGGSYRMTAETDCYLSAYGTCSDIEIDEEVLNDLLEIPQAKEAPLNTREYTNVELEKDLRFAIRFRDAALDNLFLAVTEKAKELSQPIMDYSIWLDDLKQIIDDIKGINLLEVAYLGTVNFPVELVKALEEDQKKLDSLMSIPSEAMKK